MSQHINLLPHPPAIGSRLPAIVWWLMSAWLSGMLIPVGLWLWRHDQVRAVERQAAHQQQQLESLRRALATQRGQRDGDLPTRAESQALSASASAAQSLQERLSKLGSPAGFSRHLERLGQIGTDGVWITAMDIRARPPALSLSGKALSLPRLLDYSQQARTGFASMELDLDALEVIPDAHPGGPQPADKAASALSFKLD